jgi:hypothetical protein
MIRSTRQFLGGFVAPLCHGGRKLTMQHMTGFVIAYGSAFLGRLIFTDREQAKAAAIGQSHVGLDELSAEGWSIVPIHAEITRIDA